MLIITNFSHQLREALAASLDKEHLGDLERISLHAGLQPHAREFLRAYVKALTIVDAADVVGIARSTHYKWMKNMSGYPEAFEHAQREKLRTNGMGF